MLFASTVVNATDADRVCVRVAPHGYVLCTWLFGIHCVPRRGATALRGMQHRHRRVVAAASATTHSITVAAATAAAIATAVAAAWPLTAAAVTSVAAVLVLVALLVALADVGRARLARQPTRGRRISSRFVLYHHPTSPSRPDAPLCHHRRRHLRHRHRHVAQCGTLHHHRSYRRLPRRQRRRRHRRRHGWRQVLSAHAAAPISIPFPFANLHRHFCRG